MSENSYDPNLYTEKARRERFVRIAERRTNRVLNDIRLLGNTSNRHLYLYSPADIEKIFSAIEARLVEVRGKFKAPKDGPDFKLQ